VWVGGDQAWERAPEEQPQKCSKITKLGFHIDSQREFGLSNDNVDF